MIWKIYNLMLGLLIRGVVPACVNRWSSDGDDSLIQINQLVRVIACIREYHGLHPAFAADTYGNLELFLKQRLSQQEWLLLNQLQVVKPTDTASKSHAVLDIADFNVSR